MTRRKLALISGALAGLILLFIFTVYTMLPQEIKWLITSVVDVPLCAKNISEKVKVEPNFTAVKSYVVQSLETGMTSDEVERTLGQIGPVFVTNTFVDDDQETNTELLIKLCDNPLGNVVLLVYYSEDGQLINIVDPYDN